jgi:hypothetical protein
LELLLDDSMSRLVMKTARCGQPFLMARCIFFLNGRVGTRASKQTSVCDKIRLSLSSAPLATRFIPGSNESIEFTFIRH